LHDLRIFINPPGLREKLVLGDAGKMLKQPIRQQTLRKNDYPNNVGVAKVLSLIAKDCSEKVFKCTADSASKHDQ
jgi:hypothetical protein